MPVDRKCSKCRRRPAKPGQRYCKVCHKLYMQDWRATQKYKLVDLERRVSRLEKKA